MMPHCEWQDPGTWPDEGPPPLDNTISISVNEYERLLDERAEMLEALKAAHQHFQKQMGLDYSYGSEEEYQLDLILTAAIAKAEAQP